MRGFLTVISLLAVLLFGSESFAQDKILSLVQQGEEYMREGKYSRARRCFELASAEIDVDHFDRDRNLNERVMNDLTESQIMLDDCSFPYLIYQYDVKCEEPREEIRRLHLGCLFWQRPIIIRMVGEEEAARTPLGMRAAGSPDGKRARAFLLHGRVPSDGDRCHE